MVQKFVMVGKGDASISIQVAIKTTRYILTRDETVRLKDKLRNKVHAMLRDEDYNVSQIKEVKGDRAK